MKNYLNHICPVCQHKIYIANNRYQCSHCSFYIPGFLINRHITRYDAEQILSGERVILDGFSDRKGKMFSSAPVIMGNTIILNTEIFFCYRKGNRFDNEMIFQGKVFIQGYSFRCTGGG